MRLVDREDINGFATGALQVFLRGQWGAVCNALFDDRDAEVACSQLGFGVGTAVRQTFELSSLVSSQRPGSAGVVEVRVRVIHAVAVHST